MKQRLIIILIVAILMFSGVGAFDSDINNEYDQDLKMTNNSRQMKRSDSGNNLVVDCNGTGDYKTIQEAIDKASSGDTIYVWDGVYYENVTIDKELYLIGNGSKNTSIHWDENDDVVLISSNSVKMKGFMVKYKGTWGVAGIHLLDVIDCRIENNSLMNRSGIVLSNSKYNYISNNHCSNYYNGVELFESDHNKISNNICILSDDDGISLYDSHFNTIKNNICNRNWQGISLDSSNFNTIKNNTCNDNEYAGISLPYDSNNNSFIYNNCTSNEYYGIYIQYGKNHFLTNNTLLSNGFVKGAGIGLKYSEQNTIQENFASQNANGISLINCNKNKVEKNICSKNMLSGITIGDFSNDNFIKENICIGNNFGLYLYENSSSNTLINNTCSNNRNGLKIYKSNKNSISNNNFDMNSITNIKPEFSSISVLLITDNSSYNKNDIISVSIKVINTENRNITLVFGYPHYADFEILNEQGDRVYLWSWDRMFAQVVTELTLPANKTTEVLNTTAETDKESWTKNAPKGNYTVRGWFRVSPRIYSNIKTIQVSSSDKNYKEYDYPKKSSGIQLIHSNDNIIENNSCIINSKNGLHLFYSNSNNMVNNTIYSNKETGIKLVETNNNLIYKNMIISNNQQALNLGKNFWNNSESLGNYWSDYEAKYPNAKNDGIVWNTPYEIEGQDDSFSKDYFPLVENASVIHEYFKPKATILSINPRTVNLGEKITFKGTGTDKDGTIIGYYWESDIDGFLSRKSRFSTSKLSTGKHTISFSVQDNHGLWSKPDTEVLIITERELDLKKNYTQRETIWINGDKGFTKENGVVNGTGTIENPYVIEGWKIDGRKDGYCIKIENTSSYFVIKDCYFHNINGLRKFYYIQNIPHYYWNAGTFLRNVINGLIKNNSYFDSLGYGISLFSSGNNIIENNYFNLIDYSGINLYSSTSNSIINNSISDSGYGIILFSSINNEIIDNNASKNNYGFYFEDSSTNNNIQNNIISYNGHHSFSLMTDCDNNRIVGNNISNNHRGPELSSYNIFSNNIISANDDYGISVQYTKSNKIKNNQFVDNGIEFWGNELGHWNSHTIDSTNTVNGKPIYYWKDLLNGTVPKNVGQIILANCKNIAIQNLNIHYTSTAIQLGFSSSCVIVNNNLSENHRAITLFESDENKIINNNCNSNFWYIDDSLWSAIHWAGIEIAFSKGNLIENNSCCSNEYGIWLSHSETNIINNNTGNSNSMIGIVSHHSSRNTISNNNASFNSGHNTGYGIEIQGGEDNIITENIAIGNNISGFDILSDTNSITKNTALYNKWRGFEIGDSIDNIIINNNASFNNLSGFYIARAGDFVIKQNYAFKNRGPGITILGNWHDYGNLIADNILQENNYGFYLRAANLNTIRNNIIRNNNCGLNLTNCVNNTIHHNNIIKNNIQAWDNSTNQWNDGYGEGNYWSDYTGEDKGGHWYVEGIGFIKGLAGDGVGDTHIPHLGLDFYPLINPLPLPDLKLIQLDLELAKLEFYLGEQITGTITVKNDNSIDVNLNGATEFSGFLKQQFNLFNIDTSTQYYGLTFNIDTVAVKAKSSIIIEFKIDKYFNEQLAGFDSKEVNLRVGNHMICANLWYGIHPDSYILTSDYEEFRIIINNTGPPVKGDDGPSSDNKRESYYNQLIFNSFTGIVVVIIMISTVFVTSTEVGKYGFFGAMIPLYTKKRKKKLDKNYGYNKGMVLGCILGNPGESYNAIKRALNLNNGSLAYYLKILEREGLIRSERDGMYKRFYPAKGKVSKNVLELSEVQKNIYQIVKENLGISQKDIQSKLDISQQRMNYHIQLMSNARLIKVEREGKRTKCFVIDDVS